MTRDETPRSVDEAKRDLAGALRHIRYAIETASKGGKPRLGILSVHEDGSGKVECKFDCQFIEDVALLLGAPDLTDADRSECRDRMFLDKLGVGR